jgi:hypothetical protein
MADQRYNGWTNYETWNVALWMGNDSSEYWLEIAQEIFNDSETESSFTCAERAALDLADRLKDDFEENTPTVTGCYADLLSATLSEVNWYEIAEHYISDCDTSDIESDEYDAVIENPDKFLEDAQLNLAHYKPWKIRSAAFDTLARARGEVNSEAERIRFRNYYRCPNDGTEWSDEWSCMCNDRCPLCNAEIEPYESEDINEREAR